MTEAYDEPGGVNPDFTLLDDVPSLPTWVKQHLTYPKWLRAQRAQHGTIHLQLQVRCEHCSFGGWLRSGGWRRFGRTPAYEELVRAQEGRIVRSSATPEARRG